MSMNEEMLDEGQRGLAHEQQEEARMRGPLRVEHKSKFFL